MIRLSLAFKQDAFIFNANIRSYFLDALYHWLRQAFLSIRRYKIGVQLNRENTVSTLSILCCHLFD